MYHLCDGMEGNIISVLLNNFQEEVNECILKLRFCLNFLKIIELINFVLLAIFISSY